MYNSKYKIFALKASSLLSKALIWQRYCVLCTLSIKPDQYICNDCYDQLYKINENANCYQCLDLIAPKELLCSYCQDEEVYFDKIYTTFNYVSPLDGILHKLKY